MPSEVIYWDANGFLSYINQIPDRMPTVGALLERSGNGSIDIYTSSLSQVEVAFAASEQRQQTLDPSAEERIDALWNDLETVALVEYYAEIGNRARALMRDAITRGWSLKPLDAIHFATAQWLVENGVQVDEFHTYDRSLDKYGSIVGFTICEPYTP